MTEHMLLKNNCTPLRDRLIMELYMDQRNMMAAFFERLSSVGSSDAILGLWNEPDNELWIYSVLLPKSFQSVDAGWVIPLKFYGRF